MGISFYLVWVKGLQEQEVKVGMLIFGIQLVLNALWSSLFFELKSPYYAFIEIVFLWLAIFLTILKFKKKFQKWLLIYYFFIPCGSASLRCLITISGF
jgi:tryptophan-rich sensory protein